jgi:putative membrane protein
MAVAEKLQSRVRASPRRVTALISLVGYALVFATFGGVLPFPSISDQTVILLSDAIAVVNASALTAIVAGVYFIKTDQIRRHRAAMLTAFVLILAFLVMYLLKVGGGFEKEILAEGVVWTAYIVMLAVHVLLSAISVPVVVHAVVLGLTHSVPELRESAHARVGRVAVAAWGLSLFLGLVTYVMLNHIYGWVPRGGEAALLLAVVGPSIRR